MMNVLLVGAGRMGLRHMAGLVNIVDEIDIIDMHPSASDQIEFLENRAKNNLQVNLLKSIDELKGGPHRYSAAILATTANNRLRLFEWLLTHDIPHILVEKPLEQSRANLRKMVALEEQATATIKCNHYRRLQRFYDDIRTDERPVQMNVNAGAIGLGCNGVHWIDFAIDLSGSTSGKLVFGELDATPVANGRGPQFEDFGGRAIYSFENGSRLFLNASADSSAPAVASIIQANRCYTIDQGADIITISERPQDSNHPNYFYGKDYQSREVRGVERMDFSENTRRWIKSIKSSEEFRLPSLREAALGHELLFDLVEMSGRTEFSFT